MPKDRRRSPFVLIPIALALALAAVALPLYGYKVAIKTDYTDFFVYYRAGARWLAQAYSEIYTLADGASPLRYAPPFLPFFGLFAHFERMTAQVLWFGLQYAAFAGGFFLLHRTLRVCGISRLHAAAATAGGFLLTLRTILDSFTIGQISGLMFFSFAVALWGFVRKRPWLLAGGALFPAWLKIGPGILLLLSMGVRDPRRGWLKTAIPLVVLSLVFSALPGWHHADLWQGWLEMIRKDSEYYDSSHYGSQSLNSVLLRLSHQGFFSTAAAGQWHLVLSAVFVLGLLSFWWFRRPVNGLARVLFFSQGLLSVMLLMPETFKYSITPIAIPLAALWGIFLRGEKLARVTGCALILTAAFIAFPGKDIVGDWVFFSVQRWSLPFLSLLTLFAALTVEAVRRSRLSTLGSTWKLSPPEVWDRSVVQSPPLESQTFFLLTPLESDSRLTQAHAQRVLRHLAPVSNQVRIILVPWGARAAQSSPILQQLHLGLPGSEILWLPQAREWTAAQALRQAVLLTPHSVTLFTNLEQVPDGKRLRTALEAPLTKGQARVWSRRSADSELEFNGRSLALAYRRYRAGARLQRWLRALPFAPPESGDLQSDAWQIHREDFLRISSVAQLNDGLWPTELRILAAQHGVQVEEFAAHFLIANEKRNSRMVREIATIARSWLHLRRQKPQRERLPQLPHLTADDWGLSIGVNQGILQLVTAGVLKRVSIMAHGEALAEGLAELLTHANQGRIQLGLHFDLTYAPAYRKKLRSHGSPARAMAFWVFGLSSNQRSQLAQSALREQLTILREHGVPVRHLDGHHHIHLLPGLLPAIAPLLQDASIPLVRIPVQPGRWWTPAYWNRAPIHLLALWAQRGLKRLGLEATAQTFLYPTYHELSDRARLYALLARHADAEILTHPAAWNDLGELKTPEPHYQNERLVESDSLALIPLWQGGLAREKN